jgi:WD40 repeat protein
MLGTVCRAADQPKAPAGNGAPSKPGKLPEAMDLCKYQTSIRNQGGRDVCPYFPPVAALEAAYCRAGHKVDLSAEHLIWLRNVTAGGENAKRDVAENLISTLGGGNGMGVLNTYAVCREQDLPFRGDYSEGQIGRSPHYKGFELEKYDWSKPFSQFLLNRWNLDPARLPPVARANAKYRIEKFVSMPRQDVNDPRKWEEVLASGHEIVFAVMLHRDIHELDPAQPVWRRKSGSPAFGYHFMLAVGYDRRRQFLVVKNQWGPTNYSANKQRLAPEWKDIVRYDGYTLMDYNYLAGCGEAHYITQVAPVDSPGHVAQRALGQWQVAFQHKSQSLKTGVLCWRRLPDTRTGTKPPPRPNRRIGDLVAQDGEQFRVNADLQGDGTGPYKVKLYIDFVRGALPVDSTGGTVWEGALTLSDKGAGSLRLRGSGGAQDLWRQPAREIEMNARLVEDRNLLKDTGAAVAARLVERPAEITRDSFNGDNGVPAHIYCVTFSPNGRHFLAAGDAGGRSPVRIYDAKSGKLICRFLPDEDIGWTGGRFSPDGSKVVSWGSTSPNLYLWEAATGKQLLKLEGHREPVGLANFSPDGKQIVSGSADHMLRIWDASTGKGLRALEGHTDHCAGVFSPDGKRIISYSGDRTVRGWDAATGKELWQQAGQSEHGQNNLFSANRNCFSKDGTRVLSFDGDGSVGVFDVATGKHVFALASPAETHGAGFLADGRQLVSWGKDKNLRIWDATSGKAVRSIELGDDLQHEPDNVIVSSDGRLLLTGHGNQTVRVWSLATGRELHRFETAPQTGTRSLAFSPDGRFAAGGSFRGWVYLWRLPGP